ncbi:Hha/YmoA family nucleoid-associated regulatory protein [Escherichia coli]
MKTRKEWLYQLRKCTSRETIEKVIEINSYKLSLSESEAFFSAADHRRAELVMNKLYDRYKVHISPLLSFDDIQAEP